MFVERLLIYHWYEKYNWKYFRLICSGECGAPSQYLSIPISSRRKQISLIELIEIRIKIRILVDSYPQLPPVSNTLALSENAFAKIPFFSILPPSPTRRDTPLSRTEKAIFLISI